MRQRAGRIRSLASSPTASYARCAHGMPPPGTRDQSATLWWGIVPIPEGTSGSTLRIGLRARSPTEATLSPSWVRSSWSRTVDTAGAASRERRRDLEQRGNGHRTWHPKGGPVIAIAMTTHRPPMGLFRRQSIDTRADARELGLRDQRRRLKRSERLDAIREILGDDPRFRLLRPTAARCLPQLRARARVVPREAEFVALCAIKTTTGTRTSCRRSTRHSAPMTSSRTATCASSPRTASRSRTLTGGASQQPHQLRLASDREHGHGRGSMLRREVLDYALPFPPEVHEQRHDHWLATSRWRAETSLRPAPLYDYVQHADAALGHTRPTRAPLEHARQRWRR